jgi:type VI secretion system protein ImpM
MRCGLFGKLPAKRDFVAISAPRAFLRLWEPWLELGLVAGRASAAKGDWAAAFNTAPIWRFWLGPALCGEPIAGAFMPSVDALGRMFPLTLIGAPSGSDELDPPDVDSRDDWFAGVEAFLLDALDPQTPFDIIVARLDGVCSHAPAAEPSALARMFAAMRANQQDCPAEAATFWWTIGGADCPPLAMMRRAMPTPATFADMLSRRQGAEQGQDLLGPHATAHPG